MFKQERSAAHEEEDNDEEKEKDKEKEEKDKEEVGLAETSVFCPSRGLEPSRCSLLRWQR